MEFVKENQQEEAIFDFDLDDLLDDDPLDAEVPEETQPEEQEEEPTAPDRHPMADKLERLADRLKMHRITLRCWTVLGIPLWTDSVKAHRDLSLMLHPDRYADAPEELQELSTTLFDKIRAAWEVLENDEERKKVHRQRNPRYQNRRRTSHGRTASVLGGRRRFQKRYGAF